MLIKVLKPFTWKGKKYIQGENVTINVDKNNIPLEIFWRNRIQDSQYDNCIEIVTQNKKPINNKINGTDIS